MNNSSNNSIIPPTLSCFDQNLSQSTVTPQAWMIYEPFHYGAPGVATVMIVFFLIAFTWNILIISCIIWKNLLKQPAHLLLFNLATTDLLVSICVLPINITSEIALEFIFGGSDRIRCNVCQIGITFTLLSSVSLHTIALLSLDRFLFLYLPLRYKKMVTFKRTLVTIVAVWVLCIAFSIPPLFGFGEVRFSTTVGNCYISFFGETHITRNIYYILLVLLEALIPIGILIVTNVWLLCLVNRHLTRLFKMKKSLNSSEHKQQHQKLQRKIHKKRNKQQLQLLRVFGAIFLANIVTWLPAIGLAVAALSVDFNLVPAEVVAFVYITYISHSVIHPLLETCFISELRDTFTGFFYYSRRSLKLRAASKRRRNTADITQRGKTQASDTPDGRRRESITETSSFSCVCCACVDECGAALLPDQDESSHTDQVELSSEVDNCNVVSWEQRVESNTSPQSRVD